MNTTSNNWPPDIFVLIPSYRAAQSLSRFIPSLKAIVPESHILVVNDGLGDNTETVCANLGIHCISHIANSGKGSALKTGFTELLTVNPAWIITMDADGQHSPSDIFKFIDESQKNPSAGIIIGARSREPGYMPLARIFSNRVTSGILSLMTGQNIIDSQCGFRMYSARLLRKITIEYQRFQMESEVIIKAVNEGFRISSVPVQTLYCSDKSHISHLPDTIRWVKAVCHIWWQSKHKKLNSTSIK